MKVSLQWLREFVDLPTEDPDELTEAFSSLGMQVEEVEAHDVSFAGVVVGQVEDVRPHPNADRLRLCSVAIGERVDDVVCGAWNFESGAVVPVAVPGSVLADGTEVGIRDIRGFASHGMICSPKELGLGEDAEGILVLNGAFEIGQDFASGLPFPDVVFDLEIESNRADEMSMLGVARELAAYFAIDYRAPEVELESSGPQQDISIEIEDPVGCGRFFAIPADEVQLGPSPLNMQLRLQAAGVRPINNVVDVTNYVMLELGQPLHAFDLDRIAGAALVVRRAEAGERLATLDGIDRSLHHEDLIIADSDGVTSLAGVMGGETSEVSQATTKVLLEAAHWDPPTITSASTRHGLRTEASIRFSRGVDPGLPPLAARRAAQLLQSQGSARISETVIDHVTRPVEPWKTELSLAELPRLLGVAIAGETAAGLLRRLGMEVEGEDPLVVTVPTWRPDVTRAADLVEEVARLYGYNSFPETVPFGTGGGLTASQTRLRLLREVMAGAGFTEALTFPFVKAADLEQLGLPGNDPRRQAVAMKNPVSEDEGLLRTTLMPGLLEATARNVSSGHPNAALFETGRVFLSPPSEEDERIPSQPWMMAFVAVGVVGPEGLGEEGRLADVHTATGAWRLLTRVMGIRDAGLRPEAVTGLHPGRGATTLLGGADIGYVGELHPQAARAFDLSGRVAVGEMKLAPLVAKPDEWTFQEPSPFPPVVFDLAFEVPVELPSAQLLDRIVEAAGPRLESVRLFDEFVGEPIPAGKKSLALRLVLRAPDRTLSQDDVHPIRQHIASAVSDLEAKLRGEL